MIATEYKEYAEMLEPKLKHTQGNILNLAEAGEFDIVVQGCNCFNTMGGGIAKEIRERYPTVAEVDSETERGDYNKLGTFTEGYAWFNERGDDADNFVIINAYTQFNMSTGQDVFEYTAFQLILQKLAHLYPTKRFGFPLIGQGLARGNPARINEMLENFAATITATGGTVTIVKFNQ
jgi:O-acetyl-ADP-ribose deacetylase (regulator of RNase III)